MAGNHNTDNIPEAENVVPKDHLDHEPGIYASEGDTWEVDPAAPTTETDYGTAKAQAVEGSLTRTRAVKGRRAARLLDTYGFAADWIDQDLQKLGKRPKANSLNPIRRDEQSDLQAAWDRKWTELMEEREDLDRRTQEALDEASFAGHNGNLMNLVRNSLEDPHAREEVERWVQHYRKHARANDNEATRREEWAGILHNRPPSQAFMDTYHSSHTLTPGDLYYMERQELPTAEGRLAEMLNKKNKVPGDLFDVLGAAEEIKEELAERLEIEDIEGTTEEDILKQPAEVRPYLQEALRIIGSIYDASAGDMKNAIVQLRNLNIKMTEAEIAFYKRILGDVRNGSASDPNYDPSIFAETQRHDESDLGIAS